MTTKKKRKETIIMKLNVLEELVFDLENSLNADAAHKAFRALEDLEAEVLALSPAAQNLKTCTTCHQTKPLDAFYRKGKGHQPRCKQCSREYAKSDARKATLQRYNASAKKRACNQRYREKRPAIREAVHQVVYRAVKRGDLIRPEACEFCGDEHSRIEGHHPDYNEPLRVLWLCPSCHTKLHNKEAR